MAEAMTTVPDSEALRLTTNSATIPWNEGDSPSFPVLYRENVSMIRNVLFRICGSTYLDDLTQETFIKVWRGLAGFQHDSSLKTWIYSIATRVAIDHFRKRGDTLLAELDETSIASRTNEEADHVRRDLVRKGLQTLSFDHRTTLVLHVLEGLSLEEVAQITNAAIGTVKSRLHYARNSMAEYLRSQGANI